MHSGADNMEFRSGITRCQLTNADRVMDLRWKVQSWKQLLSKRTSPRAPLAAAVLELENTVNFVNWLFKNECELLLSRWRSDSKID